jgi:hypothetical protein
MEKNKKVKIDFRRDYIAMDFLRKGFTIEEEKEYLREAIPNKYVGRHRQTAYKNKKKYTIIWDIVKHTDDMFCAVFVCVQVFEWVKKQWTVFEENAPTIRELREISAKRH